LPEGRGNKKAVRKKTAIAKRSGKKATDSRTNTGISSRSVTRSGTRSGTRVGMKTGTISDTSISTQRNATVTMAKARAKASLSLKFSIPVALIVGAVIAVLAVFLARMTTTSVSNEVLKSGVSQVRMLATYAKPMLLKADQLYKINSEQYLEVVDPEQINKLNKDKNKNTDKDKNKNTKKTVKKSPLDVADANNSWPVDLKLVDVKKFDELASGYKLVGHKGLDRLTPKSYVEAQKTLYAALKLGLLASFINQEGKVAEGDSSDTGSAQTLAAYIICTDPAVIELYFNNGITDKDKWPSLFLLARSEHGNEIAAGNLDKLTMSPSNWVPRYVNLSEFAIAGRTYKFSTEGYSNPENLCQVTPREIELNNVKYKVLAFSRPIFDGEKKLGVAYLCLRAEEIVTEVDKINTLLWATGGVGFVLAILTCVIMGYIVTRPAKTLIQDMSIVAEGNFEHRTRAHSNDEIGLLAMEFNDMTKKLLVASKREKEAARLENELEVACEIQMKLLPPRIPKIKGFDLHAVYHPAKEVGGDYYDFFPIDARHVGIIVADVSGKGIPGSMVMATTRTILRFVAGGNLSSADTLAKTNTMVAADIKRGMFVTAFYLVLDVLDKKLLCSSAGHNPMVIHHASGEVELINPNGIALGFDKGRIFSRTIKEQEIQLESGDRVILYTDGVVEAMNIKSEEYTDDRFYEFVKDNKDLNCEDFIEALLRDLDKHKGKAEQHDDITAVALRVL